MDRKRIEKNLAISIFVIFFVLFLAECIFAAVMSEQNTMELLTVSVGFPQMMLIILLIDVPPFLLISILASTAKEIALYMKSDRKEKKRLLWSSLASVLSVSALILFFLLSNTVSSDLSDALYIATLVTALLSAIVFAVYIIINKVMKRKYENN